MKYINDILGVSGLAISAYGVSRISVEGSLIYVGIVLMMAAYKGAKG